MVERGRILRQMNGFFLNFLVDFVVRSATLITVFFNDQSILARRVPVFYGPRSVLSKLYRVYVAAFAGFLLSLHFHLFFTLCWTFLGNAVGVGFLLGWYGGLVKLASIPHFLTLGYAAFVLIGALLNDVTLLSLSGVSCVGALSFLIPVLIGDVLELYQWFILGQHYVLMPSGTVHPVKGWLTVDRSVK